jgi:exopolysaccharide biosynthesis protein
VGGIPVHAVQVDLRLPQVRLAVVTPRYGIGTRESWSAMIDRARPTAAITGTYFSTSSAVPVGTIIAGGRPVHAGFVGTALAFAPEQGVQLVACRPWARYDWSGFDTVLRAGPRLLTDGRMTLYPYDEGFRDPAILARKRRSAVGVTRHGKLLLVGVQRPVYLRTLAAALRDLGAVDAMCLDGGNSSGLFHRGKTWVKPGRALTNLLVVYESAARYEQVAGLLNPPGARLAGARDRSPG